MNKKRKRKHLDEIQLARSFAIFAVLFVHSSSSGVTDLPTDSSLFSIYNFINIAGKLGTPTFIMLSSFVLFYNYYPRTTDMDLIKSFYKKRLKYILVPYIVFSAIYFIVKWYLYYDYPNLSFAIKKFLSLLALGKAHPHLYFVFISVQFYVLFPLLLILFKKFKFLRKNAIWIGLILQWLWVILNKNYFQITMKGSISLSYLSFYFVGAYLGIYYFEIVEKLKQQINKYKTLVPLFTSYVVLVILYTSYMYMVRVETFTKVSEHLPQIVNSYLGEFLWATHALIAGVVLFYVAHLANRGFGSKMKTFFMEIGATSFGIYLIHPLFLLFFRLMYSSGPPLLYHGWQIMTFILVTLFSWAVVRLTYRYIPMHWIIFGQIPKQKKFTYHKSKSISL